MELPPQHPPDAERLGTSGRAGEHVGTRGRGELVDVELEPRPGRGECLVAGRQLEPPDLGAVSGLHAAAEGMCEQLAAEADTQHR